MKKEMENLRNKTEQDLIKLAAKLQKDIQDAATEVFTGKSTDVSKTRKLRKELARVKTVLNQMVKEVKNA